jgi:metacaspase-1
MKSKAFLFGLNYANDDKLRLNGCINDVHNMALYLKTELGIPCEIMTDDINKKDTTAMGMLNKLYQIAMTTYSENLDLVWIHYSGHGASILDKDGDEKDGYDEALVPIDVNKVGVVPDDYIQQLFTYFNPKTRVIAVFDCCHSGTIGDVMYSWEGPKNVSVENILCDVSSRIITLSGCLDVQTAADAYDVLGDKKFIGAMTACLLLALQENKEGTLSNVFTLLELVRKKLVERGFEQKPKLCSTYNLARDPIFVPRK